MVVVAAQMKKKQVVGAAGLPAFRAGALCRQVENRVLKNPAAVCLEESDPGCHSAAVEPQIKKRINPRHGVGCPVHVRVVVLRAVLEGLLLQVGRLALLVRVDFPVGLLADRHRSRVEDHLHVLGAYSLRAVVPVRAASRVALKVANREVICPVQLVAVKGPVEQANHPAPARVRRGVVCPVVFHRALAAALNLAPVVRVVQEGAATYLVALAQPLVLVVDRLHVRVAAKPRQAPVVCPAVSVRRAADPVRVHPRNPRVCAARRNPLRLKRMRFYPLIQSSTFWESS